jgi:hypothetical protein
MGILGSPGFNSPYGRERKPLIASHPATEAIHPARHLRLRRSAITATMVS